MKIFTLALVMLCASYTLHAQNTKIDTLVSAYWDGANWLNNSRTINIYDADCRLDTALIQNWNNGSSSWVNAYITYYSYLSGDFVSSTLTQNWNGFTNSWENNYLKTITYNGALKILSIIDQTWYFGSWRNFISITYSYDNYGYEDSSLMQISSGGQPFQNASLSIRTNKSDGIIQEIISKNWNGGTNLWDNSTKYTYNYNSDKTMNTELLSVWNVGTSTWDNNQQLSYFYDGQGTLLSYLTELWQSGQWENQSLNTNAYDGNKFLTNSLTQFWSSNAWVNDRQTNYVNNNHGSIQTETIQDWDIFNNIWTDNLQRTYSYSPSCLLPIKLISFSAIKNHDVVALNWQTSEEINISNFTIQRSLDGVNFTNINTVPAKGGSVISDYSYNDNIQNIICSKVFYKLKISDKNGSYTYSKTIPIALTIYTDELKVYPNPAKDQLFVLFNLQNVNKGELRITDISGKTIYNQTLSSNQNNNITSINISVLSKGTYLLSLITEKGVQKTQFIKQ